jgi:hypothetical protein
MFSDRRTHDQERRASARCGCGKHDCADTRAFVLQTADAVGADRRCIHGNSYHRGLTPPRSCIAMRTSAGIKNDFFNAQAHAHKSGGRQPAVGVGNTIAQTQARLFCRPPTVYVRIAVAFTVIVTTGGLRPPSRASACCCLYVAFTVMVTTEGLRPPLLYCDADVRRHKKRFLRCTNAHAQERRASARRGSRDAPATASVFLGKGRPRRTRTTGLRQPLRVA